MSAKIFLHLLIICGIWSQGIIGIFADEEIKQSSDFLVRQKRVISHLPGEDIPTRIIDAPFVVRITEGRRNKGVGNILSRYVAITSVSCVSLDPVNYKVFSGAATLNQGKEHNVAEIRRRVGNPHQRLFDGVALVILDQHTPFVYSLFVRSIRLYVGHVFEGSFGKVYGWGHTNGTGNLGTSIPTKLRSIEVQILSNENCMNRYRSHSEISHTSFCTYHAQRHSGHTDIGAGLVVDDSLVGIFLWSGLPRQIDPVYPDVFAYLNHPYYNQWIRTNVARIDSQHG